MVRRLTVLDIPALCAFGTQNYKEIKPLDGEFDPDYFAPRWEAAIRDNLGVVWVKEFDGEWVAILGAAFIPHPFNGKPIAQSQFWFCRPAFRGNGAGVEVFSHFHHEAESRGCKSILMGHPGEVNKDFGAAFFLHNGFKPVEILYQKDLK